MKNKPSGLCLIKCSNSEEIQSSLIVHICGALPTGESKVFRANSSKPSCVSCP